MFKCPEDMRQLFNMCVCFLCRNWACHGAPFHHVSRGEKDTFKCCLFSRTSCAAGWESFQWGSAFWGSCSPVPTSVPALCTGVRSTPPPEGAAFLVLLFPLYSYPLSPHNPLLFCWLPRESLKFQCEISFLDSSPSFFAQGFTPKVTPEEISAHSHLLWPLIWRPWPELEKRWDQKELT
jgi:hypothetical protein